MNSKSSSFLHLALAIASCLGMTTLSASADNLDFNNNAGGSGTWEGDAGGTPWLDTTTGTNGVSWNNAASDAAHFQGIGGTVDVAGDVTVTDSGNSSIYFNASSDITLDGPGTITVATQNGVLEDDTANNVTIDNNLQLDDSQASDRFDITDTHASTVTFNGNISYVGSTNRSSGQALIFNGGANTNFVLNGSFQGSATNPGRLIMSGGGSLTLNGTYTNANSGNLLEVDGTSTAYLGSSTLGTGNINLDGPGTANSSGATVLTVGAQTITNTVSATNYAFNNPSAGFPFTSGFVTIGGSTADISTFEHISTVVTGVHLTAANGGRVIIGGLNGNGDVLGLVKQGAGTVVLTQNSNETVTNSFNGQTAPYLADVQQGTLLFNSTAASGQSAFGVAGGNIQVEAGATLGGTGSTLNNQQVVAESGSSIITAGDPGQTIPGTGSNHQTVIAPVIGQLTLTGGLTTVPKNGLTLDFKLSGDNFDPLGPQAGISNDFISLSTGNMTLDGPITVNLTAVDALGTGVVYTLMKGSGDWSASDPTFTFTTPAGYELDKSYGEIDPATGEMTQGYIFDTSEDTFSVELEAIPEPSVYGLLGLGLLALVAGRFRRLNA